MDQRLFVFLSQRPRGMPWGRSLSAFDVSTGGLHIIPVNHTGRTRGLKATRILNNSSVEAAKYLQPLAEFPSPVRAIQLIHKGMEGVKILSTATAIPRRASSSERARAVNRKREAFGYMPLRNLTEIEVASRLNHLPTAAHLDIGLVDGR